MADDVVIGSASVQIVGDYSQLEKSFNESQNLAQQAGQKISAALQSSAAGATALNSAVNTVAASVEDFANKSGLAGGELSIFKAALQGSLEAGVPLNAAMQDIAASGQTLGTAVAAAAQSLQQETQAAVGAVEGNEDLSDSFKRVRNDAEALEAAWEKAIAEDKKLADAAKRDAAAFQQAWSDAIKENNARAQAEFQKFAEGVGNFISHPLQSAGKAVTDFMMALGPMGVAALGAGAALAVVGKELFNLVEQFGKAAEATQNMADRLNLTWRATRDLEEMAQIAGVSIGGLQTASFRLAEALEGTSKQGQDTAAALAKIGVVGETSGELLTGFLEKLAQIPDDTKRIALAHEVLGKSSQQIIPLIKNYAELQDAITHLGPAIDSNMSKKLTEADDALDKLSISWNRFKEQIAVFAAPAVKSFVDTLTAFVAGGTMPTIDQQIAEIERKMVSLGEKSALAGWLMADGFTRGKNAELELLKAQREHLIGVEQAIERSRQYNEEIARSNAAAKAASGGGLVQSIIDKQKELTAAVTASRAAYDTLNEAYQTGTPLANGYAVTSGDVARALSNLKAAEAAAATTKADHTEKVKALTKAMPPLSDSVAIFVKQIENAHAVHQKLIADAAAFGTLFGKAYSVAEIAAIRAAAAATDLRLAEEELGNENVSFLGSASKISPLMDEMAKSMNEATKASLGAGPGLDKMTASLKALGIPVEEFGKKVRMAKDDASEFVAANSTDMDHVTVAWQRMNSEVNRLASVNLPEAISMQEALIASMQRMGAPLGQIENANEKLLQLQIRLNTEQGKGSNAQIIALANIRAGTAALASANNILGNTYVALMQDFQHAFDQLGDQFAKAIMEGKSFTATWKAALNQLETQILSTVIGAIIKFGVSWVTAHVLGTTAATAHNTAELAGITAVSAARAAATTAQIAEIAAVSVAQTAAIAAFTAEQLASFITVKAAATLLDVSEVMGYAAVGAAAAAASTAAIPIIGPALAPGAAAAMYGIIAAFAPLATFSEGGMVPEDMLALVHKGEYVLPAEKTAQAVLGSGTTNSSSMQFHFDFSGAHFSNGMSDSQVTTVFNRAFRMSKLAGALPPGRFPQ